MKIPLDKILQNHDYAHDSLVFKAPSNIYDGAF